MFKICFNETKSNWNWNVEPECLLTCLSCIDNKPKCSEGYSSYAIKVFKFFASEFCSFSLASFVISQVSHKQVLEFFASELLKSTQTSQTNPFSFAAYSWGRGSGSELAHIHRAVSGAAGSEKTKMATSCDLEAFFLEFDKLLEKVESIRSRIKSIIQPSLQAVFFLSTLPTFENSS